VKRFVTDASWLPKKLDVLIDAPDDLDVSSLKGNGLQPTEKELPNETAPPSQQAQGPKADDAIVAQLVDFGFPKNRCVKAAIKTQNQNVEVAMNWLLEHMEDPDIDTEESAPIPAPQKSASPPVAEDAVANLTAMGFTRPQVLKALSSTGNNVERAADWLFSHADQLDTMDVDLGETSAKKDPKQGLHDGPGKYKLLGFISHIGTSTASGHYVCHIKKEGKWVLFNDRKVAASHDPPKEMGYLYFYQRV